MLVPEIELIKAKYENVQLRLALIESNLQSLVANRELLRQEENRLKDEITIHEEAVNEEAATKDGKIK